MMEECGIIFTGISKLVKTVYCVMDVYFNDNSIYGKIKYSSRSLCQWL